MNISDFNIIQSKDKFFRYISYDFKMLSTGWSTKDNLIKNKDIIRIDKNTIEIMKTRYLKEYKGEK